MLQRTAVLALGLLALMPPVPAVAADPEPERLAGGFVEPVDAVREPAGTILVSDAGDHRVKRIELDGTVTTVAGTGQPGFSGDGG